MTKAANEESESVEDAWDKEIMHRVAEIESGDAKLIDWDEFQKGIPAKFSKS